MKHRLCMVAGLICYLLGTVAALYFGMWKMLLLPIQTLLTAYLTGTLALPLVAGCLIKILLSTTMTGLIWCIGYIAYNYFKGDEDPDWDAIEQERMGLLEEERSRF